MRGNFLSDILRFDLQTCQWSEICTFGDRPCGRYGHSACISNDYLMYIYGGYFRDKTNELSCLNLESGEWKNLKCSGEIPPGTDGHSMIIFDSQLVIFGGRKKSWNSVNSVHFLDLVTMEWKRVEFTNQNIPCPRTDHCEVFHDGKLFIQGGYDDGGQFLGRRNDLFSLDLKSWTWTELTGQYQGSPPPELSTHRAVHMQLDGKDLMILVGGWDNYKRHRNELYALDLKTLQWIKVKSNSKFHERRHFGLIKIPSSIQSEYFKENDLIIFGGCTDTVMMSDVCVLRIESSNQNQQLKKEELKESTTELKQVWGELMRDCSPVLKRVIEFGNCYDLMEWSLIDKKHWNLEISDGMLKEALNRMWVLKNRQFVSNRNEKILKLLPKQASLNLLKQEESYSIQHIKNLIHQLTDVYSHIDPHENVAWTSFPKINSLLGVAKIDIPEIEKSFSRQWSFYMALHSTTFEEYPIITSIIATTQRIVNSRETFIEFDPFIGSLIFSDSVTIKMRNDFMKILDSNTVQIELTQESLQQQDSNNQTEDSQSLQHLKQVMISIFSRNDPSAMKFNSQQSLLLKTP